MGEDCLFRKFGFVIDVELAPALGLSEINPVCGLVAGPAKARGLDEGFQKDGTVVVALEPVVREPSSRHGENSGRQIAALNPRQYQKPGVVDNEMESVFALLGCPANEPVARSRLPGCGAESEQSEHLVVRFGHVTQLSSR